MKLGDALMLFWLVLLAGANGMMALMHAHRGNLDVAFVGILVVIFVAAAAGSHVRRRF